MRETDRRAGQAPADIGRRMYAQGYVAFHDGILSVRVRDGEIWATPTGVSKGFMNASDMALLRLDGTVLLRGGRTPSSEIKMHLRILQGKFRDDGRMPCPSGDEHIVCRSGRRAQ